MFDNANCMRNCRNVCGILNSFRITEDAEGGIMIEPGFMPRACHEGSSDGCISSGEVVTYIGY